MVVPRLMASETSGFDASSIFFTDGSKSRAGTGFGVYYSGGFEYCFRLREPSGVFTSEMSAIFVALIQIGARRPGRYLVVTDSMSSLKALKTRRVAPRTHSLVYEIKEACWWLTNNGYEIHMMWIPSHVGVRGNERADLLAGDAVENGIDIEWHAPVRPSDFFRLSRVRLLECWQSGWDGSDMGRYAYSI
jgi:ribonuclease HI